MLETRFRTRTGVLLLTDFLPIRDDDESEPFRQLVRIAECVAGAVSVAAEFRPRFDYGSTVPRLVLKAENLAVVYGGADALLLQSEFPIVQTGLCSCAAESRLAEGERAVTILTWSPPHELDPKRVRLDEIAERLDETVSFWQDWVGRRTYEGRHRTTVLRSLLVLKGLTSSQTGAVVAAPTTSLPEKVGGDANWDYRYAWLRDAGLTVKALFETGCAKEGHAYVEWLRRTTAGRASDIRIMYGIGGERMLPEQELSHLEGYRGSTPVRTGNEAADQRQLDVFGAVLDTIYTFHRHDGAIDDVLWDFVKNIVEEIAMRWQDPDAGIWEQRDEPRHWVHSKVLAWLGVDRAIALAEELGLEAPLDEWRSLAERIRGEIDERGVLGGVFRQAFGSRKLDASVLLFPILGFVPFDDERVRATAERIEADLSNGGLISRNSGGDEGTFLICSCWLVENLAGIGELERARALFELVVAGANDLGLLAEEVDPGSGELLGNFPQAFSHLGVIRAALALDAAERV